MKEIFLKGGPLMYIILTFSIVGLAVVFERLIYFFTVERGNSEKLKEELIGYIERNDINGAKTACAAHDNSVARVLDAILDNFEDDRLMLEERVKEVALAQIPSLERLMWVLGITANVTPLVGLLGTVTGMIKAFNVIAAQGVGKPEMLATGISEALITTAAGLTVAIPALVMYNIFNKKIDSIINDMEKSAVEFLNMLGR